LPRKRPGGERMRRGSLHHVLRPGRRGQGAAAAGGPDGRGGHRPGRGDGQRGPGERRGGRHDPGARPGGHRGGRGGAMSDAMESLYPFLYSDTSDLSAVLDQVRASTVAKVAEIGELRRAVADRDGARIAECAREAAARFGAGGRLFAFGNGGSATDAQQLATLFLNPEGGGRGGDGGARGGGPPGWTAPPLPAFGLANDPSV